MTAFNAHIIAQINGYGKPALQFDGEPVELIFATPAVKHKPKGLVDLLDKTSYNYLEDIFYH